MEYVLNMMVCSFAETVRWWIAAVKDYTPEEATAYFMEYIPKLYLCPFHHFLISTFPKTTA